MSVTIKVVPRTDQRVHAAHAASCAAGAPQPAAGTAAFGPADVSSQLPKFYELVNGAKKGDNYTQPDVGRAIAAMNQHIATITDPRQKAAFEALRNAFTEAYKGKHFGQENDWPRLTEAIGKLTSPTASAPAAGCQPHQPAGFTLVPNAAGTGLPLASAFGGLPAVTMPTAVLQPPVWALAQPQPQPSSFVATVLPSTVAFQPVPVSQPVRQTIAVTTATTWLA